MPNIMEVHEQNQVNWEAAVAGIHWGAPHFIGANEPNIPQVNDNFGEEAQAPVPHFSIKTKERLSKKNNIYNVIECHDKNNNLLLAIDCEGKVICSDSLKADIAGKQFIKRICRDGYTVQQWRDMYVTESRKTSMLERTVIDLEMEIERLNLQLNKK